MSVRRPHWDLPLRLVNGRIAVVEQDSPAEIANCVEVADRTVIGDLLDAPEFGLPPLIGKAGPLDADTIRAAVETSEPRARVALHRIEDRGDLRTQRFRQLLHEEGA